MAIIEPNKKYSIKEIVGLSLIPGVDDYYAAYRLIVKNNKTEDNLGQERHDWSELYPETTRTTLKGTKGGKPWNKLRRIYVRGSEILKFKRIHGFLD